MKWVDSKNGTIKNRSFWQEVKSQYEAQAASNTSEITNLKMAIQEMRMKTERTKVLLLTNKERFNH
mgnify:CR=1 FL=1